MSEQELINAWRRQERAAQRLLYDGYAPKMLGVVRRYVRRYEDAEDVLIEAFFKVLTKIETYTGVGNFEGWIRRIVVNESLMFLRKKHNFADCVELSTIDAPNYFTIETELAAQDILNLLGELPTGYRTIFNLYVLEGYKHREIAELLGISINTSKSQLILAKKRMRQILERNNYPGLQRYKKG